MDKNGLSIEDLINGPLLFDVKSLTEMILDDILKCKNSKRLLVGDEPMVEETYVPIADFIWQTRDS